MNLCSSGHDEVCYESRKCPACEMRDHRDEVMEERDDLQKQVSQLESEIIELQNGEDK